MLVQLKGVEDAMWLHKLQKVDIFVSKILKAVVNEIERSTNYLVMKEKIKQWVEKNLRQGTVCEAEDLLFSNEDSLTLHLPKISNSSCKTRPT